MASESSPREGAHRAKRPSALACRECRGKHLRCDATAPTCTRCAERGLTCTYTPSRRGYRGSCAKDIGSVATTPQANAHPPLERVPRDPASWSATALGNPVNATPQPRYGLPGAATPERSCDSDSQQSPRGVRLDNNPAYLTPKEEFLVSLYFSHFHPGHPFLLPRQRYTAQTYPPYLRSVVQFVGSRFAPSSFGPVQRDAIESDLAAVTERSVALVQSLLLFAIALHSMAEREPAVKLLAKASDLAIELGLNREDFASAHGAGDLLVEESLRRTWWELYTIDGFFAALHRQRSFKCNTVDLGASLPCEERFFVDGAAYQQSTTVHDLDRRFFTGDAPPFSSGAYRIGAIRIVARVIGVMTVGEDVADNVQAVDNAIAAWRYHLPPDKSTCIDAIGTFDQMMFQARFILNCASILLHFARSELLPKFPSSNSVACSERMTQAFPTSTLHAHKAVAASKELSDLAALPPEKPSPMFACGLAFACIVQLAACSAHSHDCLPQHRERVALMTGALKHMGRVWPLSRTILQQLNQTARGTFCQDGAASSGLTPNSYDSGIDLNCTLGSASWLDMFGLGDVNDQAPACEAWDPQFSDVFGS